jgi:hypothetical protein
MESKNNVEGVMMGGGFVHTVDDKESIRKAFSFEMFIKKTLSDITILMKNPFSYLGVVKNVFSTTNYSKEKKELLNEYYDNFRLKFENYLIKIYDVMKLIDKENNVENLVLFKGNFLSYIETSKQNLIKLETEIKNIQSNNVFPSSQTTQKSEFENPDLQKPKGGKRHRKNQTRRHTNRRKRSQRHY